jgi:hypothetical protein
MKLHLRPTLAGFLLPAAFLLWLALPAPAQTTTEKADKLVRLLKECNYDYRTTKSPTVFTIHFTGTHIKDIKLVLAIGNDEDADLVIFVTVAEKRRMPATTDFRYKLLKANHDYDQVKIGFDGDDDLSARIDGAMRVADAQYLRKLVNQVKNTSDELYGMIEADLLP